MVYDVAIIGAGMAGASLAASLSPRMRVLVLETEDIPGYHATGRSAAFWSETYGGRMVHPLTMASYPFLKAPPAEFAERSFLHPRGALMLADRAHEHLKDAFLDGFAEAGVELHAWGRPELQARLPGLCTDWDAGVWEPSTCDIDVAALHQAYVRAARRAGAVIALRSGVTSLVRSAQCWEIEAAGESFQAARVVNAAGAWAGQVARLADAAPIPVEPRRRTMVQLRMGCDVPADLPLTIDLAGRFYFKPEGPRRLWLSPHDETPIDPCDVAPDEVDVARAIEAFRSVLDWSIEAVERSWAGLRSFAPDREPVFGADPVASGFYWCAGQGGFGIQTAPAIAAVLTADILGEAADTPYAGIDPKPYSPARFA